MRHGQRPGRGLEEELTTVIGAHRAQHGFTGKALGGGVMDTELGRDFRDRAPPCGAEMLGQAGDAIGLAEVADEQAGEALAGARSQPPPIERFRDLLIGLPREGAICSTMSAGSGNGSPGGDRPPRGPSPTMWFLMASCRDVLDECESALRSRAGVRHHATRGAERD
jgi:hypothetical protein